MVRGYSERILESFDCLVEELDGNVAYVTMIDQKDKRVYAAIDINKLNGLPRVCEGYRFKIVCFKRDSRLDIMFEEIHERRIREEVWQHLYEKAARVVRGDKST